MGEQDIAEDCLEILETWLDELPAMEHSVCLEVLNRHFENENMNTALARDPAYFWLREIHAFMRQTKQAYQRACRTAKKSSMQPA